MTIDKNKTLLAIYIIVFGSLFTMMLGFSFKFSSIFRTTDPGFAFVKQGIYGSILIALIHLSNLKNFIFGVFSLLIFTIVLFKITDFGIILSRFLYLSALATAIFIYHNYYYNKLNNLAFGKFIPLSGLLYISFLIVTIIVALLANEPNFRQVIFDFAGYGFIIGTGIGIGFELSLPLKKLVTVE
ncbi:MAG: hypothetical protein P8Y99_13405 [Calditrichaceae bacterium]